MEAFKKLGLVVLSDDPEIASLNAVMKAIRHVQVSKKNITNDHLLIIAGVEMFVQLAKGKFPNIAQIAFAARVPEEIVKEEITFLVEHRYLSEIVNLFGPLKPTYKMGATGAKLMKDMLLRDAKKKTAA